MGILRQPRAGEEQRPIRVEDDPADDLIRARVNYAE
jgi:hypothetical protein